MKLNPLFASFPIACDTYLIPKEQGLNDMISLGISEWANVPFDLDPDAENAEYNDNADVYIFGPLMLNFVHCFHRIQSQNHLLFREMCQDLFTNKLNSYSNNQLKQCLKDYRTGLEKDIEAYTPFNGNIQQKEWFTAAVLREKETQNLFYNRESVTPDLYLQFDEIGARTDTAIFTEETLKVMDHAIKKNYRPYGYK